MAIKELDKASEELREQLQQEIRLSSLTKKQEWKTFCEWLGLLERTAFERAYLCKKDDQRDKYFGEIYAYRNIIEEIDNMQEKSKETAETLAELRRR